MTDREEKTEVNLLYFVNVIVRSRRMIIRNIALVVVATAIVSFLIPAQYTAVTTLMPPQDNDKSAMESVLSEVAVPGVRLPSPSSSGADLLVEILKSRSVNERLLNRTFTTKKGSLPLYKILSFRSVEYALLKIVRKVRFNASPQGIITIAVRMKNKHLAADVANAYAEELDHINQEKNVSRAKNSRLYIETQLQETEKKFKQVAQRLSEFQQQHKAISIEEQTKAAIQQSAEVKAKIIAKEVELGVMQQTMKKENPLVIRVQQELDELRHRYSELQYGGNSDDPATENEFYVPFADVPEVGLQLAELTREAKVQETVWELLNQQYYQVKIQEARDTPTVQVLDKAVPPLLKSSPKRKLMVMVLGALSLIFSILWAFAGEYLAYMDDYSDDRKNINIIVNEFKKDINALTDKLPFKNRGKG